MPRSQSRALQPASAAPAPVTITQTTSIEQSRAVAEVQAAIIVAQQCPRNIQIAWAEMRAACGRLALASKAFYAVPNRGRGPSVHLARELARIWGNLDYGVKELRRDDAGAESEIQAYAWDQQVNVRSTRSFIVPHARMVKNSETGLNERRTLVDLGDVYLNNQNIGARAVRECLFTVMPSDFVGEAQDLCRKTIEKGDGQPLDKRIAAMIAGFADLGVKPEQIEDRQKRKRGQWTAADLADLSVVFSSIQRRERAVEDEFPPVRVTLADIGAQAAAPAATAAADEPSLPHEWTRADLLARVDALFERCEIPGDGIERLNYASDTLGVDVVDYTALTDPELANLMVALTAYAEQLEPPADRS